MSGLPFKNRQIANALCIYSLTLYATDFFVGYFIVNVEEEQNLHFYVYCARA